MHSSEPPTVFRKDSMERMLAFQKRLESGLPITAAIVGSSIVADGAGSWYHDAQLLRNASEHVNQFNHLYNPGGCASPLL